MDGISVETPVEAAPVDTGRIENELQPLFQRVARCKKSAEMEGSTNQNTAAAQECTEAGSLKEPKQVKLQKLESEACAKVVKNGEVSPATATDPKGPRAEQPSDASSDSLDTELHATRASKPNAAVSSTKSPNKHPVQGPEWVQTTRGAYRTRKRYKDALRIVMDFEAGDPSTLTVKERTFRSKKLACVERYERRNESLRHEIIAERKIGDQLQRSSNANQNSKPINPHSFNTQGNIPNRSGRNSTFAHHSKYHKGKPDFQNTGAQKVLGCKASDRSAKNPNHFGRYKKASVVHSHLPVRPLPPSTLAPILSSNAQWNFNQVPGQAFFDTGSWPPLSLPLTFTYPLNEIDSTNAPGVNISMYGPPVGVTPPSQFNMPSTTAFSGFGPVGNNADTGNLRPSTQPVSKNAHLSRSSFNEYPRDIFGGSGETHSENQPGDANVRQKLNNGPRAPMKRQFSNADEANLKKRANSSNASPSDSHERFYIAIIDKSEKDLKLSSKNWLIVEQRIQNSLLQTILHTKSDAVGMFNGTEDYNGYKVVKCTNKESNEFVTKCIRNDSEPWKGADLDVLPKDELPTGILIKLSIPSPAFDDARILEIVKIQNTHLKTAGWVVAKSKLQISQNGVKDIWIRVGPASLSHLRASKGEIRFGMHRLFSVLESLNFTGEPDYTGNFGQ